MGCLGGCTRPSTSSSNVDIVDEAYVLIEGHLVSTVPSDALQPNMDVLKNLTRLEEQHRLESASTSRFFANKKRAAKPAPLSQQMQSRDKERMLNTLHLLTRLEHALAPRYRCLPSNTRYIHENNVHADDPIGSHVRERPVKYSRIGALIFNTAVQRAQVCLPHYKEQLTRMTILPMYPVSNVSRYWDQVITRRMELANFIHTGGGGNKLERAFIKHPKESLLFVLGMQEAIEPEELPIGASLFGTDPGLSGDSQVQRRRAELDLFARYNEHLVTPCRDYHRLVSTTFDSFDFDMSLRRFLPRDVVEMTESDDIVNKMRAYLHLCNRLHADRNKICGLFHIDPFR